MIGFVMIGANDLEMSTIFYDIVFNELDIVKTFTGKRYNGYSKKNSPENIQLYITLPQNKKIATHGNGTMIALLAKNRDQVNRFHSIALKNGATNEGLPGYRPSDSKNYYAYIRDMNGNKICAYCTSDI